MEYYRCTKSGIPPSKWGSDVWSVLHLFSFNYPLNPTSEEKQRYKNFIESLFCFLPCIICVNNIKKHYSKEEFYNSVDNGRKAIVIYFFNLHNDINVSLNKPYYTWNEFIKNYTLILESSDIDINTL